MTALANVLGLLTIPAGIVNIHFTHIPVILTRLAVGPLSRAFAGFFGFIVSAFRLVESIRLGKERDPRAFNRADLLSNSWNEE
jgi:uncharacterized membrane protein